MTVNQVITLTAGFLTLRLQAYEAVRDRAIRTGRSAKEKADILCDVRLERPAINRLLAMDLVGCHGVHALQVHPLDEQLHAPRPGS